MWRGMVVFRDRVDQTRWHARAVRRDEAAVRIQPDAGVEREGAFLDMPAVVTTGSDDVDLFDVVLANVADPQLSGVLVEGHPVGIAESIGEDLVGALPADERVVARDAVLTVRGVVTTWIDP